MMPPYSRNGGAFSGSPNASGPASGCQIRLTRVLMTGARPKISGAINSLYVAGGRPAALADSMADFVAKMTQMAPIAPAAPARPANVRPVREPHLGWLSGGVVASTMP